MKCLLKNIWVLWKIQTLSSFACRSQWSQLNGARHFCQTLRRDTPPFHQSKRLLCTMLHFDKFLSGMIILVQIFEFVPLWFDEFFITHFDKHLEQTRRHFTRANACSAQTYTLTSFCPVWLFKFFSKQTKSIEFTHSFNLSFNKFCDEISEIILNNNL